MDSTKLDGDFFVNDFIELMIRCTSPSSEGWKLEFTRNQVSFLAFAEDATMRMVSNSCNIISLGIDYRIIILYYPRRITNNRNIVGDIFHHHATCSNGSDIGKYPDSGVRRVITADLQAASLLSYIREKIVLMRLM